VPHGIFIYNLGYLTLMPVMMCPDGSGGVRLWKDEDAGINIKICENGALKPGVYPDFSFDKSLHNWITQLSMYCSPAYQSSLFGALFFMGVLISMTILTYTAKFGRKPNLIVTNWLTLLAIILVVTIANLYTRYVGLFIMGCCMIRSIQSYILATEFAPFRLQIIVATAVLGFDVLTIPLSSVYFKFIYDDWIIIGYVGIAVSGFVTLASNFIPESPRFLYDEGEFDKARAIVNKMAKMNGSNLIKKQWKFDLEGETTFIEKREGLRVH
jgi:MFS transporter, OCT family, solute carrier family 22 (organic cation transporter), member 4/5